MHTLPMLAILAATAAPPQSTPKPAAPAAGWTKQVTVSKMDDSRTVILSRNASQAVRGWPGKVVTPQLLLRCKEGALDAFVVTGMAAAVEYGDTDGATVMVRFDKEPAQELRTGKATDGQALFFGDAKMIIATMAEHQTMLFRFTPFNSAPQETSFTLRGLAAVLKPLQQACGWDPEKEKAEAVAAEAERQRAEAERQRAEDEARAREAAAAAEREARHAAELEAQRSKRLTREKELLPEFLSDLYKGDQATTRIAAAHFISRIMELRQEAVAGILDGLKDKHWGVRQAVIETLASFGKDAAVALPQLEQLAASDPAPEVQAAASVAIGTIKR